MVVVALPGPPPVSTYAWVKTWNDEIKVSTTAKKIAGVISGSTILKNRATGPAPSMEAASTKLPGTASSAAENTSMLYPNPCQIESRTTAGMAHVFDPRKLGACTPNQVCISESTRPFGDRISEKIAALATTGVTAGMKNTVR